MTLPTYVAGNEGKLWVLMSDAYVARRFPGTPAEKRALYRFTMELIGEKEVAIRLDPAGSLHMSQGCWQGEQENREYHWHLASKRLCCSFAKFSNHLVEATETADGFTFLLPDDDELPWPGQPVTGYVPDKMLNQTKRRITLGRRGGRLPIAVKGEIFDILPPANRKAMVDAGNIVRGE